MSNDTTNFNQTRKVSPRRGASILRGIRFTPETYELLRMYKDNVERLTGSRLSDAYAIETILENARGRIENGRI